MGNLEEDVESKIRKRTKRLEPSFEKEETSVLLSLYDKSRRRRWKVQVIVPRSSNKN